jgi:hypothetical protein
MQESHESTTKGLHRAILRLWLWVTRANVLHVRSWKLTVHEGPRVWYDITYSINFGEVRTKRGWIEGPIIQLGPGCEIESDFPVDTAKIANVARRRRRSHEGNRGVRTRKHPSRTVE